MISQLTCVKYRDSACCVSQIFQSKESFVELSYDFFGGKCARRCQRFRVRRLELGTPRACIEKALSLSGEPYTVSEIVADG